MKPSGENRRQTTIHLCVIGKSECITAFQLLTIKSSYDLCAGFITCNIIAPGYHYIYQELVSVSGFLKLTSGPIAERYHIWNHLIYIDWSEFELANNTKFKKLTQIVISHRNHAHNVHTIPKQPQIKFADACVILPKICMHKGHHAK